MLAALLALLVALPLLGCVSRKLMLRSEPSGAAVILDGRRVGETPWEGDLGSYGARLVELELPGYARRYETIDIEMPWWQFPILAIVTDLVLPWTIEDHHAFSWELERLDPEAGTWDDARAALTKLRAFERALPAPAPAPAPEADAAPEPAPDEESE